MITKDGTYIKCDHEDGCIMQIRRKRGLKSKAPDWHLGHTKQYCPVHIPSWRKRDR